MAEPMTDDTDEAPRVLVAHDGPMTDEERQLAEQLYSALQAAASGTERSQQAGRFEIGVSNLGVCSERVRRMFAEIPEDPRDKLEAFIGTAVGDHFEAAVKARYPEVLSQLELTTTLVGDGGRYAITGHPDLIHPWGVGDVKTSDGLELAQRNGPTDQQLFQRHINTKAAFEAGLLAVPLDKAKTYNVWVDRSGRTKKLFVHMDDYSEDIVAAAGRWLDDVVYAHRMGEPARKEPPRTWCEKVCGHFYDCRLFDSDVSGLITDPNLITAVEVYREGAELARTGAGMKREATGALAGVNGWLRGADQNYQVRWTWINPSDTRKGYWRLNIATMKSD